MSVGTDIAAEDRDNYKSKRKRVSGLKPSPENNELYAPVDIHDPEFIRFAESICRNGGPHDPLVITDDNYIVSGHRRYAALKLHNVQQVRCRVLPRTRDSFTKDEYIALLREYNRHRHKSVAEQIREEMVDIDPSKAQLQLARMKSRSICAPEINGIQPIEIEGCKIRHAISEDKAEHVRHIKLVVEGRRAYWPLSVRGVHYPLLNYDFIRGYYWPRSNEPDYGTRRVLKYVNDQGSYDATSELLTRLRLLKVVPWEAIDDCTRPLREFKAFSNAKEFVRQEMRHLFAGYWRNLLQTQPNHIEILVEKNTVYHMVMQVAEKYQIPVSSGRGFNSIDPYHDLLLRYQASGKKRLILVILSDFDPEGEMIPQVAGRTLRDDFGVDQLAIIKAGVTREQIMKYSLPPSMLAKESSSNYQWFADRNDGNDTVYELEALDPASMLADLESVLRGVIDIDLFNAEVAAEKQEATYLEAVRRTAADSLRGLGR